MIYLLGCEKYIQSNLELTLYAFPMDIWLRETLNSIIEIKPSINIKRKNYGNISKNDFNLAISTIEKCYNLKISPLILNMGIWYYSSNFVADKGRLKILLKSGNKGILNEAKKILLLFK